MGQSNEAGATQTSRANNKKKWIIIGVVVTIIVLATVGLLVGFLVIKPNMESKNQKNAIQTEAMTKPDLTAIPKDIGSFSDDAQVNKQVPKLSDQFEYGKQPIRGLNLGGWLVLEPFIVPSLFEGFKEEQKVVDEWTLCQTLGREECGRRLHNHYNTFVTEEDIKYIASLGIDHLRIPVGFWAVDIQLDNEPYVYGAWKYLLRGLQWARKYGLRVMVEFHSAPGSQNGWNHSGRSGTIEFLNTTFSDHQKHMDRFKSILKRTTEYFALPEWENVVTMFGVLNEPAIYRTNATLETRQFYIDAYHLIRQSTAGKGKDKSKRGPVLVYHEGFLGITKWQGFMPPSEYERVVLDTHNYLIFDQDLVRLSRDKQKDFPCTAWSADMKTSQEKFGWTMCGEFSLATNDCGRWLNGVGLGYRYDGTYQLEPKPAVCPTCKCDKVDDWPNFDDLYKTFLSQFAQNQFNAFENGIGWFFWNFKTENHVNPHWDYYLGVKQGWIPNDARKRTTECAAPQ